MRNPDYKEILKDVLKKQIQGLIDQLFEEIGVDSILITSDSDVHHVGSSKGRMFLLGRQDLPEEFSAFCYKVTEENPVMMGEQDNYIPEPQSENSDVETNCKLENGRSSIHQPHSVTDVPQQLNNVGEESIVDENSTASEDMKIRDWQLAVVDLPNGIKKCSICEYSTSYPSNLKRHLNVKHHVGERKIPLQQFRCRYCQYNSTIKSNLQRHLKHVHNIPTTAETIREHASIIHMIDNIPLSLTQEECFHPNGTGTDIEKVNSVESPGKSRKRRRNEAVSESSTLDVGDEGQYTNWESKLKEKLYTSASESKTECIYCHESLSDQSVLNQHIDIVHFGANQSEFTCEICSKKFLNEFTYHGHVASHQNALRCSCGSCFDSNRQLKRHKSNCKIAEAGVEIQRNIEDNKEIKENPNNLVDTIKTEADTATGFT